MTHKMSSGTYFGQPVCIICDMQCHKAWGTGRPHSYTEDPEHIVFGYGCDEYLYQEDKDWDVDDWYYLADDELGIAPTDNGCYEGGDGKPATPEGIHNKWCVRNCERSIMADPGEPFDLPDFSRRRYNYKPTYRDNQETA